MEKVSFFFKDTKPSGQLVGWCLLLLLGFILASGLQLLFPSVDSSDPSAIRGELLLQGASQVLMFLLPAILFAVIFCGSPKQYLRVDLRGRSWVLGLLAMLVMLLITPVCDKLTLWNQQWTYGALESSLRNMADQSRIVTERLLSLSGAGDLLLQLFVVALLPAICEELFFRGCLQQILCGWMKNNHVAILATAVIFALAHGDAYGILPRLLMGVLLGYLFLFSGSVVVNICAHFFNNAMIVTLYYLYHQGVLSVPPSAPLDMPWFWVAMCAFGSLVLFLLYFVKNEGKEHRKL